MPLRHIRVCAALVTLQGELAPHTAHTLPLPCHCQVLPPHLRGQAMSINRTCGDVVGLSAPIALGLLADYSDCASAILVSAGITTCCTSLFALRARELGPPTWAR